MTDKSNRNSSNEGEPCAHPPAGIPIRRVSIPTENEWMMIPNRDNLATTPGGTMFGTTPGGTRIMYDRIYLLSQKTATTVSMTPPNLMQIPGVTYDIGEQVVSDEDEDENNNKRSFEGEGENILNGGQHMTTIEERGESREAKSVEENHNYEEKNSSNHPNVDDGAQQSDSDSDYQEPEMEM